MDGLKRETCGKLHKCRDILFRQIKKFAATLNPAEDQSPETFQKIVTESLEIDTESEDILKRIQRSCPVA